MKDDLRLACGRRLFEYHCYEGEDSSDAKLWHHTHQEVRVMSKLDDTETPMYKVKFNDGFTYEVFNDELLKSPSEYYRPDYVKGGSL